MRRNATRIKAGIDFPPPYARAVSMEKARLGVSRTAVVLRALRAYFGPLLELDEETAADSKALTTLAKSTRSTKIASRARGNPESRHVVAPKPIAQAAMPVRMRLTVVPSLVGAAPETPAPSAIR